MDGLGGRVRLEGALLLVNPFVGSLKIRARRRLDDVVRSGLARELAAVEAGANENLGDAVGPQPHGVDGEIKDSSRYARDADNRAEGRVAWPLGRGGIVENMPILFQFHSCRRAPIARGDALDKVQLEHLGQ